MSYRYMRFNSEAAFNTRAGSPVVTFFDPMDGDNAFVNLSTRPMWDLRDPGGNIPRQRGSEVYSVGGDWSGRVTKENYQLLLWLNRVNAGQTTPWINDQRPGDLASATLDFAYTDYLGAIAYQYWTGCKIGQRWQLSMSANPQDPFLHFQYSILGSTPVPNAITGGTALTSVTFPPPTYTQLNTTPLSFFASTFTLGGATMNLFDRITITGNQICKPYFDNNRFANRISHNGRTVTLVAHLRRDAATDPRTRYEALTQLGATSLAWALPSSHTLTLNFRSKSYTDSVGEEFTMDNDDYSTLTATAFLDSGTGDDFSVVYV
jgi:hypothetical protein